MDVSENNGAPKSSHFNRVSILGCFPIVRNTHIQTLPKTQKKDRGIPTEASWRSTEKTAAQSESPKVMNQLLWLDVVLPCTTKTIIICVYVVYIMYIIYIEVTSSEIWKFPLPSH